MTRDDAATLARLTVFDGCPVALLSGLRPAPEELEVEPGETIVREGHVDHEWYVVLDGEVEIVRGTVSIGFLGPGDHFGEIALLGRTPRTVTIRATKPTRVLMVTETSFNALLAASPPFSDRMTKAAAQRRAFLEAVGSSPG